MPEYLPHAVSRLRAERLARSTKPFLARGGPHGARCAGCRLVPSHCMCAWRCTVPTHCGVCLLMSDIEPLKPSNTGWLIADVVANTAAFGWARTVVDPALLAMLAYPQWQPYVVFPGEYVAADRVVTQLQPAAPITEQVAAHNIAQPAMQLETHSTTQPAEQITSQTNGKRPLFVLLDATWPEARKMFRKSPYLDHLPVLSLQPDQLSRYRLRRSRRDDHFCTSEVAALCMDLAGEPHAAQMLEAYLDVFTHHYLQAKRQLPVDLESAAHLRWRDLQAPLALQI
jgi:DTW domain-containing protein